MTRKDLKLNDTSKGLSENFDLWVELEDKNGEKISGGVVLKNQIVQKSSAKNKALSFKFEFENRVNSVLDIILGNGITQDIQLQPGDTKIVNMPSNLINVEFDETIGGIYDPVTREMISGRTAIFDELEGTNKIEFILE